jgi:hypothetical protein
MTLLEIGIFFDQIQVVHRSYHQLKGSKSTLSGDKRAHIIGIIKQLGELVVAGEFKSLQIGPYFIYYLTSAIDKPEERSIPILVYVIADNQSDSRILRNLLADALHMFKEEYKDYDSMTKDVSQFKTFSKYLDMYLMDERFTPLQRIKNYLF